MRGIVLLKEIPENFRLDKRKPSCQLLDASIFVCAITDVTRLWVEWISYHRHEETSYRP